MTRKRHALDVLARGAELNTFAAREVDDVNEAHLIVHGVMARAMEGDITRETLAGLQLNLVSALVLHARARGAAVRL